MPGEPPEWPLTFAREEDIDGLWPWLGPLIGRAYARAIGDMTAEDVRAYAKQGKLRVWLVGQPPAAAFVTGQFADGTVRFFALGGEKLKQWLPSALAQFIALARGAGMHRLEVIGRRGWHRALAPFGFELVGIRPGGRVRLEMGI